MYAILKLQQLAPRDPSAVLVNPSLDTLKSYLPMDGTEYAIDAETSGTDASDPDNAIVGLGFANDRHCFYVDLTQLARPQMIYLIRWLFQAQLVAFNLFFDGAFLRKLSGEWLGYTGDAYGLFKTLANEGWNGQRWSLGVLERSVLGWMETNKATIEAILTARGWTKADLWKLEPAVLGPYCAGDADATWQGMKVLREAALNLYPEEKAPT